MHIEPNSSTVEELPGLRFGRSKPKHLRVLLSSSVLIATLAMTFVAIQCFKTRASKKLWEVSVRGGKNQAHMWHCVVVHREHQLVVYRLRVPQLAPRVMRMIDQAKPRWLLFLASGRGQTDSCLGCVVVHRHRQFIQ